MQSHLRQPHDPPAGGPAGDASPADAGWFRAPFAAPAVGLVELSSDGRILRANDAFGRMTGYTPAELLALPAAALLFPEDRDRVLAGYRDAAAGRPPADEADGRYRRKDGSPLWARVAVARDESASPPRVAAVVTDLTEQRRLEEYIRRARGVESAGLLAVGIAHDFNNLLMIISGAAQFLLDELPRPGPAHEFTRGLADACRRATELTAQLLALGRGPAAEPRVIDLNDVVARAARFLPHALGKGIELVTRLGDGPYWVNADPRQVEQVVLNLARNARDAMPDGGRLTIETHPASPEEAGATDRPPGGCVLLTVTDTGTGMTDEVKARAFEPFFTTKEPGKGTGLGLPMVRSAAEQCGGRVDVTSRPGAGTAIHVLFPTTPAPQSPPSESGASD